MQSKDDQTADRARALPDQTTLLQMRIVQLETELTAARDVARHEQAQRVVGEKAVVKLQEQLIYEQALATESLAAHKRTLAAFTEKLERSRCETAMLRSQLQAQDTAFFGEEAAGTQGALAAPDQQLAGAVPETAEKPKNRDIDKIWSGEAFARLLPPPPPDIAFEPIGTTLQVTSTLAAGQHVYAYARNFFSLAKLGFKDRIKFHFSSSNGLNIQVVVLFFNAKKERIGHITKKINVNQTGAIPADAVWIRVGLRFSDSGTAAIREFRFGHLAEPTNVTTPVQKTLPTESLSITAPNLMEIFQKSGASSVIEEIVKNAGRKPGLIARELLKSGKLLAEEGQAEAEYPLALAALDYDRSESVLRGFIWAAQRALAFEAACDAILEIEQLAGPNPSAKLIETIKKLKGSPAYLLSVLKLIVPRHSPQVISTTKRICYVLHNSLPYSSGGYATRSHGVAGGLKQGGYEVVILTRPGFPLDTKPELRPEDVPPFEMIDSILYVRTLAPGRGTLRTCDYITAAADAMEARLREYTPEIVMAASNSYTALPALIAARRLGLPFIYEVRGLWEITRMSREPSFAETPGFAIQSILEAAAAKNADHVFTLTEPMREEMIKRGVEPKKIDLLPNSCDPSRFLPRQRDEALAEALGIPAGIPVIGYIGTFVGYEGLEDLASACALLKAEGIAFRLLMVGNENASGQDRGPITEEIARIAAEHLYSDWLIMPGRIPHEEVESYYSLIDVAPFPRKPWPVCEMVSPMKPLEALAMEKAVVVSSVRALIEMIQDEKTGMVFEKGNIESLATVLKRLLDAPELRRQLGTQGRKWVEQERTWQQVGKKAVKLINKVVAAQKKSKKK